VPYIYLGLAVVGAWGVFNAYRPIHREPWSIFSFFAGWLVGELAIQNIVWQAIATVIFGLFGAFANWAGWLGLAISVASWIGLAGLARSGKQASHVVDKALHEATGPPMNMTDVGEPAWGRWWRISQAVPLRGRATEIIKNIDYWGDAHKRHRLDVIRSTAMPPKNAPVMIYIHGGAWLIGEKREQGKPMMYELVARGWVCVQINYRLSPKGTWPDHIVDCKRAIAWVKEHIADYGGDPTFVALSGGSAGGHLSALAALTADDTTWQPGFESADTSVDVCVPFYGVMDLTGKESGPGQYGAGLLELLEKRVMKVSASEQPELFRQASPTARVRADAPPFFVLHGVNDTLVPVEVARRFVTALRAVSQAPVAYAELPLAQHAFDVLASLRCQATTAGVAAFLDGVRRTFHGHEVIGTPLVNRTDDTTSSI
jgi:acetyl esterase/lipase